MADIAIPPAALEAAARELKSMLANIVDDDTRATELTDEERIVLANAACLAMLEAWPGMHKGHQCTGCGGDPQIILPLLTENSNDNA